MDAIDGVIGDRLEDVAQVKLRIKSVERGGTEQGIDRSSAFAAGVRTGEEIVLAVMEILA